MMIRHRLVLIIVVVVSLVMAVALVTSCVGGAGLPAEPPPQAVELTAAPTETPEPIAALTEEAESTTAATETPKPTATPTEETESTGGPTIIDMDAIFPPGRGRELAVMGCTGCHNFVPLVILQFTPEEWERNARDHRERVSSMSDEDYQILYDYLTENFGPDDPVPELPQELLDQWTSY